MPRGSRHFKPHFYPFEFLDDPKALAERIRLVIAKEAPVVPPPKPVPLAPVTSGTVVVQYGQGAIPDTVTPRTRADVERQLNGPRHIDRIWPLRRPRLGLTEIRCRALAAFLTRFAPLMRSP